MTKKLILFEKFQVDLLTAEVLVDTVIGWCSDKEKKKIFYANAHTVVESSKNSLLQSSLQNADIVYLDGWGPVLACRLYDNLPVARVNAADFIDDLFVRMNKKKTKLYLLGDIEEIVKSAVQKIELQYKNIDVVGYHNGFFDKLNNPRIVKDINRKKPSIVMVGMGQPRQEIWVSDNYSNLPNAVYWCVGGLFNYISGNKKRAPNWMRSYGFEWLYRLFQEPRRLFLRYTYENLIFAYYLLRHLIKIKILKKR